MAEVPSDLTREELLEEAKSRGLTGLSQATKADIWAALETDGYTREEPVAEETVEETTEEPVEEAPAEAEAEETESGTVGGFTAEELAKAQEESDAASAAAGADALAFSEAEVEKKAEEAQNTDPKAAAKGGPVITTVSGELGKAQTIGPFDQYTEVHTARGTFALREGETLDIPSGGGPVTVKPAG